ncbi:MAG: hypothetical protein NTZ25_00310 [Candidatus Peregrinibacteria bacterium]|nr:hypothetical protein [Candidatus Peregrinibacteria bacterium]
MKKNILISIVSTTLILSGCTWFSKPVETAPAKVAPDPIGKLVTPHPIKGLVVPSCQKLYADLSKKFPKDSADESYRAAAAILFSNNQKDDANSCCDNIKDETLKKACRK